MHLNGYRKLYFLSSAVTMYHIGQKALNVARWQLQLENAEGEGGVGTELWAETIGTSKWRMEGEGLVLVLGWTLLPGPLHATPRVAMLPRMLGGSCLPLWVREATGVVPLPPSR